MTLAGFLLGTVSGSGVATTVMLGSVAWPLLRRAGYRPAAAARCSSAAGIGALLSPPTLGAAAFLIAEFLRISYLQVLVMATMPTLLYYLSIVLMIEADSRRLGTRPIDGLPISAWALTKQFRLPLHVAGGDRGADGLGHVGVQGGVLGDDRWRSASAILRRETALTPARLRAALEAGGTGRPRRRRHHRHRRHHRRRRDADRIWV